MNKQVKIILQSDIQCGGEGNTPVQQALVKLWDALDAAEYDTSDLRPIMDQLIDYVLVKEAFHAIGAGYLLYDRVDQRMLSGDDERGVLRTLYMAKNWPWSGDTKNDRLTEYTYHGRVLFYRHEILGDGGDIIFKLE